MPDHFLFLRVSLDVETNADVGPKPLAEDAFQKLLMRGVIQGIAVVGSILRELDAQHPLRDPIRLPLNKAGF